jgi:hypothetical protein
MRYHVPYVTLALLDQEISQIANPSKRAEPLWRNNGSIAISLGLVLEFCSVYF